MIQINFMNTKRKKKVNRINFCSIFIDDFQNLDLSRMYSNAEQEDLWTVLTLVGHENNVLDPNVTIKQIMDTWTLQTGYPIVTATRNREVNSVTLSQQRFFLDKENKVDYSLWWIPVTYADSKNQFRSTWMKKEPEVTLSNVILDDDDWFLININQTGYYRVNYDVDNWLKIIRQLQDGNGFKVFDLKNRAQLLDDALSLAFSGYISYDIALNVTLYLVNEREYIPWKTGMDSLDYLYDMFVRTAHFDKYKVRLIPFTFW